MNGAPSESEADLLALPTSAVCRDAFDFALAHEEMAIANHSIRSYLFARLLVRHDGVDLEIDSDQLFTACVLHDIGLSPIGNRANRFEVDGADVAAEFLTAAGVDSPTVDAVWDAIALHGSAGLAARRSALCAYTQAGIWADFGGGTEFVSDRQAVDVHRAYPRYGLARVLADAVVGQGLQDQGKAPRYSIADAMIQERRGVDGLTRMEKDEASSRWASLRLL